MSLLLSRLGKPATLRSSLFLLSKGFSSSSLLQTPPCFVVESESCGDREYLNLWNASTFSRTYVEKKVPLEVVYPEFQDEMVTIGASHGWIATLYKEDGILRLQDDLNPVASDTDPKRIPLPPLVTLPHCQTRIVTNIAMSSSSPEDEDCVVAVKFLGPQLSFCRPAQGDPEWNNIRTENPCFFNSRVMFSEQDDMFRLLGSGGHLIGSWDLRTHLHKPKFQRLRFQNLPELTKTKRELFFSCSTSEHLVESRSTGEMFLVKRYLKTTRGTLQTKALMVFKLDEQGNAVYTNDIGDLTIFISMSEPFCVPASSFPGMDSNRVEVVDIKEHFSAGVPFSSKISYGGTFSNDAPYYIPPQNVKRRGKDSIWFSQLEPKDPNRKNRRIIALEDNLKELHKSLEEDRVEGEWLKKKLKDMKDLKDVMEQMDGLEEQMEGLQKKLKDVKNQAIITLEDEDIVKKLEEAVEGCQVEKERLVKEFKDLNMEKEKKEQIESV